MLHDPALLGAPNLPALGNVTGFVYCDALGGSQADEEQALDWLRQGDDVVAVTLGSFVSLVDSAVWAHAVAAVWECGLRALLLNAGRSAVFENSSRGELLAVGSVPFSRVAGRVRAVIHHGGIGTSYGFLAAGCPAVVIPQAFDQPFNAKLLAKAGAGIVGSLEDLTRSLNGLLSFPRYRDSARSVSAQLVPTTIAATRVSRLVLERVGT
jgi:UDP:flavonoid glycosyltransferase YjiC (YdhE family)